MKVIVEHINKKYKDKKAISSVIKYIFDDKPERTKRKNYNIVGAIGTPNNNVDNIIKDFKLVKKIYKKVGGKQLEHFIISFENSPNINDRRKFKKLVVKTASFWSNCTQVAYALHEDTDNLHIHIVLNSIMFNGKRLDTYKYYNQFFKYCCNIWDKYI